MTDNEPIHRFEGIVKKVRFIETQVMDGNDSDLAQIEIVNKMSDKIIITGPKYQLSPRFKKKQELIIMFTNSNKPLNIVTKPTEPIKKASAADNKKPTSIPMPKGKSKKK